MIAGVHHVGITVDDLDRAVAFWERLVGVASRDRRVLQGPQLANMVGYGHVRIDSCWIDLPGGVALELLQYLGRDEAPYDPGTAHPGNVHVCLHVDDMDAAHAHAVACGATPVSERPIDVAEGPRAGTRLAYLRNPGRNKETWYKRVETTGERFNYLYKQPEINELADVARELSTQAHELHVIFNNNMQNYAVTNARMMVDALGLTGTWGSDEPRQQGLGI